MSKLLTILILLLFWSLAPLSAQNYEVTYNGFIGTRNGTFRTGKTVLQFNDTASVYLYPDWPIEGWMFSDDGGGTYRIFPDQEQFRTYTSLTMNVQYETNEYSSMNGTNFVFTHELNKIDWSISGDTVVIGGYTSYRAETDFGGRHYTAYFSPEIPVPFGPYLFGGLPGLIMEMQSDDGLVAYAFEYLRPIDNGDNIHPPTLARYITDEDFEKYVIDLLLSVENLSTESSTTTNGNPPSNHDIIKDRWTIVKDYKRARGY